MSSTTDDFFEGKRPWSVIKDQVLRSYMPPYLAKVQKLGKPILLVDGYAGPGVFDGGEEGSPLIMCSACEKSAPDRYQAFFFNRDKRHHEKLQSVLQRRGWLDKVEPILGDTTRLLPLLRSRLRDQTVFLYLDPFGPTGCAFDLLEPFLTRSTAHSTEIVIMMHMPVMHRLAAGKKVRAGDGEDVSIQRHHQTMTRVFGGEYWKDIMLADGDNAEEREFALIKAYRDKLATHLPYTGFCPVRVGEGDRIKYFIVFASRHPHAMLLMNDAMNGAYFQRMHQAAFAGTLLEQTDWRNMVPRTGLVEAIITHLQQEPGLTRDDLWLTIVQDHFMHYRHTDYIDAVQKLVESNELSCPTPRKTKRLNGSCQLHIAQ